jgi:hypothetical protein
METNKLWNWGQKNLSEEKRLKEGTVENYIRERVKSWTGHVP